MKNICKYCEATLSFSICLTTFNEQGSIESLVESLLSQTLKPQEIVICDGGSQDGTVEIIKELQKKYKNIKLIVSLGNVAHGRNIAIKHAKGEIIVCIDAGCIAKEDWLERLVKGFIYMDSESKPGMTKNANSESEAGMTRVQKDVDIAAGFYEMKYKTSFQKVMALYRGTPPERYDPKTFIPSCRSVALKKSVWKALQGFNERLALSGEDTQFFYKALRAGYHMKLEPKALVEWREPQEFTFKDFKKFFYYARGDAQTCIWWDPIKKWMTHNTKILTIYLRYVTALVGLIVIYRYSVNWIPAFAGMTALLYVVICLMFYVSWSVWKWRDVVTKWSERIWVPVVQIGTDIMVMVGFLVGAMRNFSDT